MKKHSNYLISFMLVAIGIVIGVLGSNFKSFFQSPQATTNEIELQEVSDLMSLLSDYGLYFENDDLLMEGALRGIMESLGDPYSVYFSEKEMQDFNNTINSSYTGIGIYLYANGDYPLITKVIDHSPALLAGLIAGDTIVRINDTDLLGMALEDISSLIKDHEANTLLINRANTTFEVSITNSALSVPTVLYDLFEQNSHKIGYLQITVFSTVTYPEFLDAITALEEEGMTDLIIDVRDDPGGLLSTCTQILDYFLNSPNPYMYEEKADGTQKGYYLNQNPKVILYPIALLINENSASASEVFSAAMNELGGYPLIGKTSFGKGIVQEVYQLKPSGTGYIKLTTYKWLTPNQEWIQHIGITPTHEVDLTNISKLSYIDSTQTLEFDHVNQEITDVQQFLNLTQQTSLRIDGYFDLATELAVETYQSEHDLNSTGIIDSLTAYYMNQDIIHYILNPVNDEQYQAAIQTLLSE